MCTSERIRSLRLFYRKFKYICESIFKYLYLAKKDRVSFVKARMHSFNMFSSILTAVFVFKFIYSFYFCSLTN